MSTLYISCIFMKYVIFSQITGEFSFNLLRFIRAQGITFRMFGFGNMFGNDLPRGNFQTNYRAYSVSMLAGPQRTDVEKGGKIIMPPSALDTLTRLHIQYPMLFKLSNKKHRRDTHCGVLEFVADEGKIYLPYWMMRNLLLQEGDLVTLGNVSLGVATYAKFRPQHTDFLDITNPKAVLENALRNFATLTKGDMVAIKYNDKDYELCVQEVKPGNAVSIIECDMNVEFDSPVGYQEPERVQRHTSEEQHEEEMAVNVTEFLEKASFRAFNCSGNRLDGKSKNTESAAVALQPHEMKRGIPNYDYKKGKITFLRAIRPQNGTDEMEDEDSFHAFSGEGQSLRKKPSRKV